MLWRRSALALLAVAIAAPSASRAADPIPKIDVSITVHQLSRTPGPSDPRSDSLDRKLRDEFRYANVRVLEHRDLRLSLNETGSLRLPSGRMVNVKPRKLSNGTVLMAVEVEGRLRTSLRLPAHHEVVIGAESNAEGKVVLTLVPDF